MRKLLFFRAPWCDPCNKISPVIDDVLRDEEIRMYYSGVEHVDIEVDPIRASKNNVNALPTFIIVNEKYEEISRHVGIWTGISARNKIIDWLVENC